MLEGMGRARLAILGALIAVALCAPAALAAPTPPPIDDIQGWYVLRINYDTLYTVDGSAEKGHYDVEMLLEMTGPTTLQGYVEDWAWYFTARYENGIMVVARGETPVDLPDYTHMIYAAFSGKPGKIKMTGEMWFLDYQTEGYRCYSDTFKGKFNSSRIAVFGEPASEEPTGQPNQPIAPAANAAPNTPPEIGDLVGAYDVKIKGTIYEPALGARGRVNDLDVWDISVLDTNKLSIVTGSGSYTAYYDSGIIVIGYADDDVLAQDAGIAYLTARFLGGRIIIAGHSISTQALGLSDGELETARLQAFQRRVE